MLTSHVIWRHFLTHYTWVMSHMLTGRVTHWSVMCQKVSSYNMTRQHAGHDLPTCVTWLMCNESHMLTGRVTHCVTHVDESPHILTFCHEPHWHVDGSCHTLKSHVTCWWVLSHVDESCYMKALFDTLHMSHVTHVDESPHILTFCHEPHWPFATNHMVTFWIAHHS